ncbi:enoyl-CoA hydratase/isomerase family protein [Hydrogenophaga sp.]|uniref:enoyl-CoA hydratase/isomerase family protein n=1 Tax=Hydrogenophaga sp. TaxID=1904254 RepID=UPI003565D6A4
MSYPDRPEASTAPVLCWREGAVVHIRFNRPQRLNAIDLETAQAFHAACRLVADDGLARVVVLGGEGRAFLAGGDVAAMRADPPKAADLIPEVHAALQTLVALPLPVIAQLHGAVAGAGLGVMMACDLAIAAQGTRFSIGFTTLGASADSGTTFGLPRMVGLRRAMQIAMLAEPFDADTALAMGLVNAVVPADEIEARTQAWALRLAAAAPMAMARLKALLRSSLDHNYTDQLHAEALAFADCAATQDFAEGVNAFLDKRPAQFKGL